MIIILFFFFRFLVPRNDFAIDSLHTFLTTVSQEVTLSSWRRLTEKLDKSSNNLPPTAGPDNNRATRLTSVSREERGRRRRECCRGKRREGERERERGRKEMRGKTEKAHNMYVHSHSIPNVLHRVILH